jgi:transposase
MRVAHPRCAGIDIHKKSMTVCIFADGGDGSQPAYHKRNFDTHSQGIEELQFWMKEHQVTEVGMEATGVYWKPVWNALEGKYGLHLCNPEHIRAIPGAKTDLRDGTRIADLLAYGKLPVSFIPPLWQRELRDLTRMQTRFKEEVASAANRVGKVLEDAQIKLGSVATDILGKSGRLILKALIKGETDETVLSEMAKGLLKRKKAELRKVLRGGVRDHHRFELRLLLEHVAELEDKIWQLQCRIWQQLEPYEEIVQRLDAIPGVDRMGAAIILAEIGPNVDAWEDAGKLACWACLCPGNKISAGKRLSGRMRQGNRWLRSAFCQMAWASTRKKGSYFKTQFRRIAGRRGKQRAVMAVAHTLLVIVYHLLRDPGLQYRELGEDYFDKRDAQHAAASLVKRLNKLGFEVTIKPKAA